MWPAPLAEVRIGALTAQIPKATSGNNPGGLKKHTQVDSGVVLGDIKPTPTLKPKAETIRELGFTPKQVERFEKLAKHPEIVEQAKAEVGRHIGVRNTQFP